MYCTASPGTVRAKEVVFDHVRRVAAPDATVFGATLLHDGVHRNWFARQVMARNNRVGIFSNRSDDLDGLREVIERQLANPTVEIVGCVALFAGTVDTA